MGHFCLAGCPWVEVAGQLCLQLTGSLRELPFILKEPVASHHEPSGKASRFSHPGSGCPQRSLPCPGTSSLDICQYLYGYLVSVGYFLS